MLLPITVEKELSGRNAYNRAGYVVMDPKANPYAAIWAQECYEALLKLNPIEAIKIRVSDSARRDMELMSHEIEVQAALKFYGRNALAYRRKEAVAMCNGYAGLFGKNVDKVDLLMQEYSPKALAWVRKYESEIRRKVK